MSHPRHGVGGLAVTATGACAFCAIVDEDAPAEIVWRSDRLLAFLDTSPLFHGHVLLVPTEHIATFDELPPAVMAEFGLAVQRLQRAVEAAMEADGSLLIVNNVVSQSVPHLHQHVIPRRRKDGLRFWLGPRHRYESDEQRAETAERIRAVLAAQDSGESRA